MRIASLSLCRAAAVLVLLGAGFAGPAHAQTSPEPRVITFNEAARIALEQNVTLKQAANDVELTAVTVTSERADFYPNLNFSAGSTRNYGLSFDPTTGDNVSQTSDFISFDLSSSVNLFNGFADVASLKQSRHALDADASRYERTRQTVLFNVIQNYLQVVLEQERVRIREEDVAAQRRQLQQIDEFVRVGSRPVSDQYQQQATLATSELRLIEAQQAVQVSTTRLIQVLQLDPFGDYTFTAPSTDEVRLVVKDYDLSQMLQRAFDERADLDAQASRIDAYEAGIRVARSGYLPSVSLSAGIGTDYSSSLRDAFDQSFGTQLGDNRAEFVRLGVSVPIFNRLQTRANVERARVQYENAALSLQDLEQQVALDVRQAYLDYQTAAQRLDATAAQLRAAEQALQVEEERYDVGASTLVELTQARSRFVEASSNRAQAVYQFFFQEKVIDYYLGVLDPSTPLVQ